jgi:aminoglycoside N3'-acetyltransferase
VILTGGLIKVAKDYLRGPYKKARLRYMRVRHGFGRAEFLRALRDAGIQDGDAVLVHSTMNGFEAFNGTVSDIVNTLKDAIGPNGTILMPALSISGSALDFAKSGHIFDVRTTPSQTGMITEVFRRSPGVSRSVHPTHSVTVWGKDSAWWIQDHHRAGTPCGRGTPYHHLLEREGKIALLGTGIAPLTFFHTAEELIEERMPFSPFTAESYTMSCRTAGVLIDTAPMRLYDPSASRRRTLQPLEQELRSKGAWAEGRAGTLNVIGLKAHDILTAVEDLADRNVFCYKPDEARRSTRNRERARSR